MDALAARIAEELAPLLVEAVAARVLAALRQGATGCLAPLGSRPLDTLA